MDKTNPVRAGRPAGRRNAAEKLPVRKSKPLQMLSNLSISQKMILLFVGSVILPLFIQNAFFFKETEDNIQKDMMRRLTQSLNEKASRVNGTLSAAMTLVNRFRTNEQLYGFLNREYHKDIDFLIAYQEQMKDPMVTDLSYNGQVRRLTLYTNNPTVFNGALVRRVADVDNETLGESLQSHAIYPISGESHGPFLRVALETPLLRTSYDRSVSIIRPLTFYPQYQSYEKAIRLDLELTYIASMLRDSDMFERLMLVDPDGRILVSTGSYSEFGPFDHFREDNMPTGIVALRKPLADMPLELVGFYDTNVIAEEFSRTREKTVVIAFGSILIAVLILLLITGNITRRTRRVVHLSKQIATGHFAQIDVESMGRDEIGELSESMNAMSAQLQALIEEKYRAQLVEAQMERETVQAKLSALQSQVNPHFMFNALECIRLKSVVRNETETARMLKYMSRMFRHLIVWEDDIIPLKDDLRFLDEFLHIQKYRFEDEFEHVLTVGEQANECLLPKLIIQPLVENACVHGVKDVTGIRRVEIGARVDGDRLLITVSDNGGGLEPDRLRKLQHMLSGGAKLTGSVGLYNVYQRLLLYYGKEFSFGVTSRVGEGTLFTITVPVRHTREEFACIESC